MLIIDISKWLTYKCTIRISSLKNRKELDAAIIIYDAIKLAERYEEEFGFSGAMKSAIILTNLIQWAESRDARAKAIMDRYVGKVV